MRRPNLDDALESIFERCEHAVTLAAEAYQTPDGDDETGEMDPIFAYSESVTKDAFELAVIGLFILARRSSDHLNIDRSGD
jgi:hypothetical protein